MFGFFHGIAGVFELGINFVWLFSNTQCETYLMSLCTYKRYKLLSENIIKSQAASGCEMKCEYVVGELNFEPPKSLAFRIQSQRGII